MLTVTSARPPRRTIGKAKSQEPQAGLAYKNGGLFGSSTSSYSKNKSSSGSGSSSQRNGSNFLLGATTAAKTAPSLRGGRKQDANTKGGLQTLLAVSRQCRLCGQSLGPMEAAVHACEDALTWPHGGEGVALPAVPEAPRTKATAANYRFVRVSSAAFSDTSCGSNPASAASSSSSSSNSCTALFNNYSGSSSSSSSSSNCTSGFKSSFSAAPAATSFQALWQHILTDFSHGFDPPSRSSIDSKNASVLLALRGRRVAGLVWVERISRAHLVEPSFEEQPPNAQSAEQAICPLERGRLPAGEKEESPKVIKASLGVVLIWTQRSERRKGLASQLLDVARHSGRGPSGFGGPVPLGEVAFSQTTHLGSRLAHRYVNGVHGGLIPEYHPEWMI